MTCSGWTWSLVPILPAGSGGASLWSRRRPLAWAFGGCRCGGCAVWYDLPHMVVLPFTAAALSAWWGLVVAVLTTAVGGVLLVTRPYVGFGVVPLLVCGVAFYGLVLVAAMRELRLWLHVGSRRGPRLRGRRGPVSGWGGGPDLLVGLLGVLLDLDLGEAALVGRLVRLGGVALLVGLLGRRWLVPRGVHLEIKMTNPG